jgi:hypothetical protein
MIMYIQNQACLNSVPFKLANRTDRFVTVVSRILCLSTLFILCIFMRASFILPILERISESIAIKSFRLPSAVFISFEFFRLISSGLWSSAFFSA